jgi:peptidoglycan/xylan/chitin deacetylase (PgdA/CDA1 family)
MYLHAHFNDRPGALPRFSMGRGAVFMIQRVAELEASLASRETVTETDPQLLQEMLSLIAAQKLDVVSLDEMRRRLVERDLDRRFVCFTFDGAYRSVATHIVPLFEKRGLPLAVYVGADYLDGPSMPWWLMLETLLRDVDRLSLDVNGLPHDVPARTAQEKRLAFPLLFRLLAGLDAADRLALLKAEMAFAGVEERAAAERQMLSRDELRDLGGHELVTIGTMAGGSVPLSELSYDRARESVAISIEMIEAATGTRPRHLAFPGGLTARISARDVKIAADLGLDTAVTNIEGSLWPEHARELAALPRIALDNDPATLVRVLMLSGGSASGAAPSQGVAYEASRG